MTIQFKCPACESALSAPDETAGRKAKCRQCGGAVTVPNPAADRSPPGMAPRAVAPQAPLAKPQPRAAPTSSAPALPKMKVPEVLATAPLAAAPQTVTPQPSVPHAQPVAPAQPSVAPVGQLVAKAIEVATVTASSAPPPLAVPIAIPIDDSDFLPDTSRARAESERSPIDDIAMMLEFEKSAPITPVRPSADNPSQTQQGTATKPTVPVSDKRIRFGETLRITWNIYKANFGACLGASVFAAIGCFVTYVLIYLCVVAFANAVGYFQLQSVALRNIVMASIFAAQLLTVIFFTIGFIDFLLQLARGKPAEFSRLFGGANLVLPALGLMVVVLLAVFAGSLLLLVPGLLAAVLFSLSPVALIDKEEGMIAAMGESARLVSANLLMAFLLLFSVGLLCGIVSLVTLGLGALVTGPFQTLLAIVIYLRAAGRLTAGV